MGIFCFCDFLVNIILLLKWLNNPFLGFYLFTKVSSYFNCGVVSLNTFLEKYSKVVSLLESLRFQGRSERQGTLCVINI